MLMNPDARARVEIVAGDIPILHIEDFYLDPDAVRAQALAAAYDQSIAFYPGRHAPIDTPEAALVKRRVCEILSAIGDRVYLPDTTVTDFSIVTTRASELLVQQKHPHIDPTPVFGLVYLNPGSTAGTSFFHNRVLGTHRIVGEDQQRALAAFLQDAGPTYEPAGYDLTGSVVWDKIHTIEGRWNRLVVYPGNVFHAIDIRDVPEQLDLDTARLTQRIIIQDSQARQ